MLYWPLVSVRKRSFQIKWVSLMRRSTFKSTVGGLINGTSLYLLKLKRHKHFWWIRKNKYSGVPPIVLDKIGLNSKQVSLMRPIYIEKCILVLKQVVLIARMVLFLSGLFSGTLLYKETMNWGYVNLSSLCFFCIKIFSQVVITDFCFAIFYCS